MITSGILFAINSTGGAKAIAGFAAIAAAVLAIGKAIADATKSAQSFDQAFSALSATQRAYLVEVEATGKGLIDTKQHIDSLAILAKAGMKNTGELMKAITTLVIDEGQKVGKTCEQMTADHKRLTEGIAKGSTRALKEFGLDLESTEVLLDAQAEGMEKVIARADGLTVSMKTLSEQTYALENNWDTYLGLLMGSIGTSGVLGKLNSNLEIVNETLMMVTDSEEQYRVNCVASHLATQQWVAELVGATKQADRYAERLRKINQHFKLQLEYRRLVEERTEATGGTRGRPIGVGEAPEAGMHKALPDLPTYSGEATPEELSKFEPKRPRGGSGGAKAAPALTGAALWQAELDAAEASRQVAAEKHAWLLGNSEAYWQAELRLQEEALAQEEANNVVVEEQAVVTQEAKWELQLVTQENERALAQEHHDWLLANSAEYRAEEAARDKQAAATRYRTTQASVSAIGGIFTNLSSLMRSENKKQFEVGKKAAYAATVVNTAAAAMGAFKSLASIPYVGFALGIAAAAATVVAGGVQLATIKKQKFDAGGGGVSAGAVGSGGGGYLGGGGGYAAGGAAPAQSTHVTVYIGDEQFHDAIVKQNDAASQKGDPAFATEEAA